jgi:hypothetical protein
MNLGVGLSGTNSMWINNFNKLPGEIEELLTPVYDMTSNGISTFSFRYAYAPRSVDNTDQLRVLVSKDCGNSWLPRRVLKGNDLKTVNGNINIPFTPQGQNQWREASFTLSPFANEPWLLVKFEFTSGNGNNIYLDDINIFEPLSIAEADNGIEIYPNPFTQAFQVYSPSDIMEITVFDFSGRKVINTVPQGSVGTWVIDMESWPSGVYYCELRTSKGIMREKLIKI